MRPTKTPVTAEELFHIPDDGYRYELVKGELRRMVQAGSEHGVIMVKLTIPLGSYVEENDLGIVLGAETGFTIATDPDTVRAPDIGFVRRERIPARGIPKGYWPGAPDLAVEVISPTDTYTDVEDKITDWLNASTRIVVVINPHRCTVKTYRSHTDVILLTESDQLTLGDVIPGFTYPVAKLFV